MVPLLQSGHDSASRYLQIHLISRMPVRVALHMPTCLQTTIHSHTSPKLCKQMLSSSNAEYRDFRHCVDQMTRLDSLSSTSIHVYSRDTAHKQLDCKSGSIPIDTLRPQCILSGTQELPLVHTCLLCSCRKSIRTRDVHKRTSANLILLLHEATDDLLWLKLPCLRGDMDLELRS